MRIAYYLLLQLPAHKAENIIIYDLRFLAIACYKSVELCSALRNSSAIAERVPNLPIYPARWLLPLFIYSFRQIGTGETCLSVRPTKVSNLEEIIGDREAEESLRFVYPIILPSLLIWH